MPRKRKLKQMTFEGEWKPVAYDQPFMMESGEDFLLDGLVEIEELTDYTFKPSSSAKAKLKETAKAKLKETAEDNIDPIGKVSKRKLKLEKRKEERKAKRLKKKAKPVDEKLPEHSKKNDRPGTKADHSRNMEEDHEEEMAVVEDQTEETETKGNIS